MNGGSVLSWVHLEHDSFANNEQIIRCAVKDECGKDVANGGPRRHVLGIALSLDSECILLPTPCGEEITCMMTLARVGL